mmetsp:Transcript_1815/g.2889  ORF Transcript_1815/g.2889 Transcript_1815/m.2889 type:complete len:154 (+) Transcript_1815:485-946(+)
MTLLFDQRIVLALIVIPLLVTGVYFTIRRINALKEKAAELPASPEPQEDMEEFSMWIVAGVAVLVLGAVTVLFVYNRRERRQAQRELDKIRLSDIMKEFKVAEWKALEIFTNYANLTRKEIKAKIKKGDVTQYERFLYAKSHEAQQTPNTERL